LQPNEIRARLRGFLDRWHSLLDANGSQARDVLNGVPADRIRFEPDREHQRYLLNGADLLRSDTEGGGAGVARELTHIWWRPQQESNLM
jgi:hypothetical protein